MSKVPSPDDRYIVMDERGWFVQVCYCCSCQSEHFGGGWDAMCHNHGAHGIRGCEKHEVPRVECDCGCNDYTIEEF